MASRYEFNPGVPQPARRIMPSPSDVLHVLRDNERLDNLAYKYYNDPLLSWVIMSANPEFDNEFEIPAGTEIRIPFPIKRVFDTWLMQNDL